MPWEIRPHREAVAGLYAIERKVAVQVREGINKLAQMEDPRQAADFIENDEFENEYYIVEIHAHFVKFELWIEDDERNIMTILSVE